MTLPTYRTHPMHVMPGLDVQEGYDALAAAVQRRTATAGAEQIVVIDGFSGTQWPVFIAALRLALARVGLAAEWYSTQSCFLSPAEDCRPALTVLDGRPRVRAPLLEPSRRTLG